MYCRRQRRAIKPLTLTLHFTVEYTGTPPVHRRGSAYFTIFGTCKTRTMPFQIKIKLFVGAVRRDICRDDLVASFLQTPHGLAVAPLVHSFKCVREPNHHRLAYFFITEGVHTSPRAQKRRSPTSQLLLESFEQHVDHGRSFEPCLCRINRVEGPLHGVLYTMWSHDQ